jgi:hypothetical protein
VGSAGALLRLLQRGSRRQVLSGFFFAAGKSTLFRIRR